MGSRAEDLKFRDDLAAALHSERLADQLLERLPMVPAETLATKDDFAHLRGELLGKFGELRGEFSELRGEFSELRGEFGELRGEVRGLAGDLRGEMSALRADMHRATQSMIKWVAGLVFPTLVVGIGVTAAVTG